jgi:hypothetical protein
MSRRIAQLACLLLLAFCLRDAAQPIQFLEPIRRAE